MYMLSTNKPFCLSHCPNRITSFGEIPARGRAWVVQKKQTIAVKSISLPSLPGSIVSRMMEFVMVPIRGVFLSQLAAKFGSAQMQKMSYQILTVSLSIVDSIQNVQSPVADLASI